eukprot:565444-Rhodomonas_salina.5
MSTGLFSFRCPRHSLERAMSANPRPAAHLSQGLAGSRWSAAGGPRVTAGPPTLNLNLNLNLNDSESAVSESLAAASPPHWPGPGTASGTQAPKFESLGHHPASLIERLERLNDHEEIHDESEPDQDPRGFPLSPVLCAPPSPSTALASASIRAGLERGQEGGRGSRMPESAEPERGGGWWVDEWGHGRERRGGQSEARGAMGGRDEGLEAGLQYSERTDAGALESKTFRGRRRGGWSEEEEEEEEEWVERHAERREENGQDWFKVGDRRMRADLLRFVSALFAVELAIMIGLHHDPTLSDELEPRPSQLPFKLSVMMQHRDSQECFPWPRQRCHARLCGWHEQSSVTQLAILC